MEGGGGWSRKEKRVKEREKKGWAVCWNEEW